jgi:HlyD family secretion protein
VNEQRKKSPKIGKTILKWAKRVLGVLVVVGVLGMLVSAWMPKPVPVDSVRAETGELMVTVNESGRTRVKDRYVVSAPLAGNVARIHLDPGDSVEEGQELARILSLEPPLMDARSRAQAEARVSAARAAARQARSTEGRIEASAEFAARAAERQRGLAARGSVASLAAERADLESRTAREELSSAGFAVRVADYELRVAEAALRRQGGGGAPARQPAGEDEQVLVQAPVAGKVLRVIQESEGVVQAGSPLLELGDASALEIVVDVLTSDAVHIAPGAQALIERWGGETTLRGRVRVVEPSAFTRMSALGVEEQRVNVVIDLDEDYEVWRSLGDGYRVEARIIVWRGEDVLRVPASAVFRDGDGWALYTIRDGKAALTSVEVGHRNGLEVEITAGLDSGTEVILHPSDQITDAVEVEVR